MPRRLFVCALILVSALSAQRRVDPKNMYHRLVCIVPYVGQGTDTDPRRPKYAPWPPDPTQSPKSILGYTQVPSDDGRFAIVEFVALDAAAFDVILHDKQVKTFVKGRATKAEIETEARKYKRDFQLDRFGVVIP